MVDSQCDSKSATASITVQQYVELWQCQTAEIAEAVKNSNYTVEVQDSDTAAFLALITVQQSVELWQCHIQVTLPRYRNS